MKQHKTKLLQDLESKFKSKQDQILSLIKDCLIIKQKI